MTQPLLDTAWRDFTEAADTAVRVLHSVLGMDVWLVTSVLEDDQTVIAAHPAGLVPPGTRLSWADAYCRRMVSGEGPRVAPVVAAVPAYAELQPDRSPNVAAYVGVPLTRKDGSVFGTLCGFGFRAQSPRLRSHLPLVELVGGLLAALAFTHQEGSQG